jgi:hypothetical protein
MDLSKEKDKSPSHEFHGRSQTIDSGEQQRSWVDGLVSASRFTRPNAKKEREKN